MNTTSHATINRSSGMNILNKINLSKKFSIIILSLLFPIAVLFTLLIMKGYESIHFTEKEIEGVEYAVPLRHLAQHLAEHRGMTTAYLNGKSSLEKKLVLKREAIKKDLSILNSVDARLGEDLKATKFMRKINEDWASINGNLNSLTISTNRTKHSSLIFDVLELITHVGDTSNLILDPDLDSFYLMDLIINKIPSLTEMTGRLRSLSSSSAAHKWITEDEKFKLKFYSRKARNLADGVEKAVKVSADNNPIIAEGLTKYGKNVPYIIHDFTKLVEKEIVDTSKITIDSSFLFKEGTKAITVTFLLFDKTAPALVELLENRIKNDKKVMFIEVLVILLFVAIAITLAIIISRSITRPLAKTVEVFGEIGDGNYENSIIISGKDEISMVQNELLNMQEKLSFDRQQVEKQAIEMRRIKAALDCIETRVTLSDADNKLIFMNKSSHSLFDEWSQQLSLSGQAFTTDGLMGHNLSEIFQDDNLRRIYQAPLDHSQEAPFEFSGRSFNLIINPVYDDHGEYQGRFTQWVERTTQLAVEQEIQAVVDAAQSGDLSQRISLEDKQGSSLTFAQGVNQLVEINELVISELVEVLGAMAEGDLTHNVMGDYSGQFKSLQENTNKTILKLKTVIAELQQSSFEIAQGVREIADNNMELSNRTEEQASNLEQTAAAMEEITSMVQNNAESSATASELANSTRSLGDRGNNVLNEAIKSMADIGGASQKIENIIAVINEISFQTNLLALNASVEAAHAGDQGKGFAVVATEVRDLAQRSSQAAKEIKVLIEDSGSKVSQGSNLVSSSGEALGEIVGSVNKVGDLLSEISNAGVEQAKGIEDVNIAITKIDSATQSNTAMVEQTAASSMELGRQAEKLTGLIAFFKVDNGGTENYEDVQRTNYAA
jgi:methyl-accepting chemotaxis protein